jgi:hypothetical protein
VTTASDEELFEVAAPLAVDRLGRGLMAVPAGRLRVVYLEERIRRGPPLPLVRLLACAQRESVLGIVPARLVVEAFGALVEEARLPPTLVGALAAGAIVLGEEAVVPLLSRPAHNDAPDDDPVKVPKGSLAAAGETLGRRKSLARVARGDLLLKVLDDPHPEVILNALCNPRVTERLAVRVAARRPVPPAVLEVVSKSRFASRAMVRRAIVLNPSCPAQIAFRILATMTAADLRDVAASNEVGDDVRTAAQTLIEESPSRS